MGQEIKRLLETVTIILLVILTFIWGASALVDQTTVVATDRPYYNPWDTVSIIISDTSELTAWIVDPEKGEIPLVLVPSDSGYTAEYSPQQGIILGTYTVVVSGPQVNDTTQFEIIVTTIGNLTINTSQEVYEAGQKVELSIISPQGIPVVWVTDPMGNSAAVKVTQKNGVYTGTFRPDRQIILGEYQAEAESYANGSKEHAKVGFTISAPTKPPVVSLSSGVEFLRILSGPRTGQHKVPPETNINVTITVNLEDSLYSTNLVDYFPKDWIITNPNSGIVSIYDVQHNMISWPVSVNTSVTKWYIIESPQRTTPPTIYNFFTRLGGDTSGLWKVTVADPTNTYYFHPETVNVGVDGIQKVANSTDNTGDTTDDKTTGPLYSSGNPNTFTEPPAFRFYTDPAFTSNITFTSDTTITMWFDNNYNDSSNGPIHYKAIIYDYDPSTGSNIFLGSDEQDFIQGLTQLAFTIPTNNKSVVGGHRLTVVFQVNGTDRTDDYRPAIVYDSSTNNSRMTFSYFVDTLPPQITNISASIDPQVINNSLNISASVTDNVIVSTVYINITLPNSTSTGNFSMIKNGGNIWYYNYTPPIEGQYNFTIYSNDTSDNWNSAAANFTAQTPPNLTFALTPEYISSNILTKLTLEVSNTGQAQADSVTVDFNVPAGFDSPSTISDGGSFDEGTHNITWDLSTLPGSSNTSLTFWSKCSLLGQFNFSASADFQDVNNNPYGSTADLSVNITAQIVVYNGTGADPTSFNNIITRLEISGYSYTAVDETDIINNNITSYDLVIIGSGDEAAMTSSLGATGLTNIQTFVENGGGYIGFGSQGGGGGFLAGNEPGGDDLILTDARPVIDDGPGQCVVQVMDTTHPVNNGYSGDITIWFEGSTYFTNMPAPTVELSLYDRNIDIKPAEWNSINGKTASFADQRGLGLVALFGWDLLADNQPKTENMFENAINWAIRKALRVDVNPLTFQTHRNETKQVNVTLYNNHTYDITGTLMVAVPAGWIAENSSLNPITFNLSASGVRNYIFNVTAYQGAFHANYTIWAYATYEGKVSQDMVIAQIIGPSVIITRSNPPLFIEPLTNTTVTLTINNSALAEETARDLIFTEMVPSTWQVNTGTISPGASTWESGGIYYIQWSLPDLGVGAQTSVSYEVTSPETLLQYSFDSNATYIDNYSTNLESLEFHQATVVAALNFSASTLIVPMDDKQSGNSTRNGYPRQLVAYGFLYNITSIIPTIWTIQDVGESFTANTTDAWSGTPYTNENYSGGPFVLSNLTSAQQDLVIQTAIYYNISLHNSTDTFTVQRAITTSLPSIAYYLPTGDPDQYNRGREDLILQNSLIEFTYVDKNDVLAGNLENYNTLIVPSKSLSGTGPLESDVIDQMYNWLVAGGNLWLSNEAAYEMVKYKGILDLTTENFQRGGYGDLLAGNNLTITQTHIVTQTYGQVQGYPGWYDMIFRSEYSRSTLAVLEQGPIVLITGKEGSGDVYVTSLELFYDQIDTASNTQGRRLINNFVFVASYRSAAQLEIQNAPPGEAVYPGSSNLFNISVVNTGNIVLNDLIVNLATSLPSSWMEITPINYSTLGVNYTSEFTVNITPPSNATIGQVLSSFVADSREGATDSSPLSIYISDLIVETDMNYDVNVNQAVNITVDVTDLSSVPTSGASVDLTVTAPDSTTYNLTASETVAGSYEAQFNDTGQNGIYTVETLATKGSNLGYNCTYFAVDFLQVDFSFYNDSGYTFQFRDFDINEGIYVQVNVIHTNGSNVIGALTSFNITTPNGTVFTIPVVETGPGIYRSNFSSTQIGGDYVFYALAIDSRGITGIGTDTLSLPQYSGFAASTLVIPMGLMQNTNAAGANYPSQISAYGLVHWLLINNITVDWVISTGKNYSDFDFNATTDDDASNTTGTILDRNYFSGPFLIKDPDTNTSWNEAWNTIQQVRTDTGLYGDVVIHELNQTLMVESMNVYVLDRPIRVAIQDTDARDIGYLWDGTLYPSAGINPTLLTAGQIRTGDLLTNTSVNCTKRKVYDWVFFGDSDFSQTGTFPVGDDLFTQLNMFVNKTGHVHLQGLGLTMNTRTSWLTTTTATYDDDDYANNQPYSVFNQVADHPMDQTYGTGTLTLSVTKAKTFDAFEHDNNWRSNTLMLAGFSESVADNDDGGNMWDVDLKSTYTDTISGASEDNYAFVSSNTYGGVTSSLVNILQSTTPEMRLALNTVMFSVITPQFDHQPESQAIRKDGATNLTVNGTIDSGMLVYNLKIHDELPSYAIINTSSIQLFVEGSYTYQASNNTIIFDLGNPGQDSILNGTLFSYSINITPPLDPPKDLVVLNSTVVYDDNWNTGITSFHCMSVLTIDYLGFIVNKTIAPGPGFDNYTVTLNLTNPANLSQTNLSVYDLVPTNFNITNPVPNYNGSLANRYYWTMNLSAGESKIVTYNMMGTGRYNMSDAFTVGLFS